MKALPRPLRAAIAKLLTTSRIPVTEDQAERAAYASNWEDFREWCGTVGKRAFRSEYDALQNLLREAAHPEATAPARPRFAEAGLDDMMLATRETEGT